MIGFTSQLDTHRTPEEAFELLADMAELARWNPNVSESTRIEGARLQPGSKYLSTIARGPLKMTARSELMEIEQHRSVLYEGSISVFWSADSLTFEPFEGGTRITFRNETKAPVWIRPLAPFLNAAFQRQAAKAVDGARHYLIDRDLH